MTNTKKIVAVTLFILSLGIAGNTQSIDKAKLDQFFDRLAEKNKAMGSVDISKGDLTLYSRSIGYSKIDENGKTPLTATTKFRVGSITKMFTAAMILQLIEEGKLSITDTLARFFSQIPNANKITIVQLLSHRSGIHDVSTDRPFQTTWGKKAITKEEMLAAIASATPDFEPGAKHAYSNSGYFILGMIIEKTTGQSYQQALQKRITSKINLKDTYEGMGNIDPAKNESFSYRYGRDWELKPEIHSSILFGSGSIVSTPHDLAKFIHALFDGKIISKQSLEQMKTQNDGYGLGMTTFNFSGKTLYGHTGGIDNFGAWVAYLPEEKLAVAYASNAKVYPVGKIMDGIFDIYWNKPFVIPTFESLAIDTSGLDKYVGVYSSEGVPVKYTISREGATLFMQVSTQPAAPLEATAEDKFKIDPPGLVVEFDKEKKQMTIKRGDRERVFTKEN